MGEVTVDGIDLKVERNGTAATLAVSGEVDLTSAPALEDEITGLVEASVNELILDLSGVGFMDSTGLRVLLKASKMLEAGKLTIRGPSDPVRRLLEVSGLNTHFDVS